MMTMIPTIWLISSEWCTTACHYGHWSSDTSSHYHPNCHRLDCRVWTFQAWLSWLGCCISLPTFRQHACRRHTTSLGRLVGHMHRPWSVTLTGSQVLGSRSARTPHDGPALWRQSGAQLLSTCELMTVRWCAFVTSYPWSLFELDTHFLHAPARKQIRQACCVRRTTLAHCRSIFLTIKEMSLVQACLLLILESLCVCASYVSSTEETWGSTRKLSKLQVGNMIARWIDDSTDVSAWFDSRRHRWDKHVMTSSDPDAQHNVFSL